MSISFQFAFDERMCVWPALQRKVEAILLGLQSLSKDKDASNGELYRAVRAGYEKTQLQKLASTLKGNKRPGVFEFVEMLTLPQDTTGQTIYVIVGLLDGKAYQARLHQKGMGLQPVKVVEVNDADLFRRVWSQAPKKVSTPIDNGADDGPLIVQAQGTSVQVGGETYLTNVAVTRGNVREAYQN